MKTFKQFLLEALKLSQYRNLMRKFEYEFDFKWEPKQEYFEIFSHYNTGPRKNKKPYRIYFPNIKIDRNKIKDVYHVYKNEIKNLSNLLIVAYKKGILRDKYDIEDYIMGILKKEGDEKNLYKLGKILSKIENEFIKKYVGRKNYEEFMNELRKHNKKDREGRRKRQELWDEFVNKYDEDNILSLLYEVRRNFENNPLRSSIKRSKYTIVISHHPYDIAGMSTNRGWTSCMDLADGVNNHFVLNDIKEGTIIAYAVDNEDLNIQKPICRVLIKPFINPKTHKFILVCENVVYGAKISGFLDVVNSWVDEVNKKFLGFERSDEFYCLAPGLYDDGGTGGYIGDIDDFIRKHGVVHLLNMIEDYLYADNNTFVYDFMYALLRNSDWNYLFRSFDIYSLNDEIFEFFKNMILEYAKNERFVEGNGLKAETIEVLLNIFDNYYDADYEDDLYDLIFDYRNIDEYDAKNILKVVLVTDLNYLESHSFVENIEKYVDYDDVIYVINKSPIDIEEFFEVMRYNNIIDVESSIYIAFVKLLIDSIDDGYEVNKYIESNNVIENILNTSFVYTDEEIGKLMKNIIENIEELIYTDAVAYYLEGRSKYDVTDDVWRLVVFNEELLKEFEDSIKFYYVKNRQRMPKDVVEKLDEYFNEE